MNKSFFSFLEKLKKKNWSGRGGGVTGRWLLQPGKQRNSQRQRRGWRPVPGCSGGLVRSRSQERLWRKGACRQLGGRIKWRIKQSKKLRLIFIWRFPKRTLPLPLSRVWGRWPRPTRAANQRAGRRSPRTESRVGARRLLLAPPDESNKLGWAEGGSWGKQGVLKLCERVTFRTHVTVARRAGSTHGAGTCSPPGAGTTPWSCRRGTILLIQHSRSSRARHRTRYWGLCNWVCYAHVAVTQKYICFLFILFNKYILICNWLLII